MALAETLSLEKLLALYEDDWHNLYKPISITDTNLIGSTATTQLANDSQLQSRINDILERQSEMEDLLSDVQSLPTQMQSISDAFNAVQNTVEEVRSSQEEIKSFLDDILDFENQSGHRID